MTPHAAPPQLDEIIALSHDVGRPDRDLVILAEGNTSVRTGEDRMLVKTTGSGLAEAAAADFVEVDLPAFWRLIDAEHGGDESIDELFGSAVTWGSGRPSVESLLHAVCQRIPGVRTVVHTHPVAVNQVLCSDRAEGLAAGSLFPDQIVVLGSRPLLVPYVDPGLPLARHVSGALAAHVAEHGSAPRVIYLRNHGMFALGSSSSEAMRITEMAVKTARVLSGALAIGEPEYLADEHVRRIDSRPDEVLRRRLLDDRGRATM